MVSLFFFLNVYEMLWGGIGSENDRFQGCNSVTRHPYIVSCAHRQGCRLSQRLVGRGSVGLDPIWRQKTRCGRRLSLIGPPGTVLRLSGSWYLPPVRFLPSCPRSAPSPTESVTPGRPQATVLTVRRRQGFLGSQRHLPDDHAVILSSSRKSLLGIFVRIVPSV